MRRFGLEEPEIRAALLRMNLDRLKPPLPEKEVLEVARKSCRYSPDQLSTAWAECHFEQMLATHGEHGTFPIDVLPKCLGDFVSSVSKSVGGDHAFAALPAMSALAAAIGNSRRIKLKDGWTEPSIIWTTLVAESGSGKSAPFDACMEPLREWQDLDRGRTLTSDATVEGLVNILADYPKGLILARDELSGWFGSFGAYKSGPGADTAAWLEMHGGRSFYVDRVNRGSVKVSRSSVSVSGTIQPQVFASALNKPEYRESGLIARLLLACPPVTEKVWSEQGISSTVSGDWKELLWILLEIKDDRVLTLSSEAKSLWVQFYNQLNRSLKSHGKDMKASWKKLEGYAARLALVFQMVEWASGGGSSEMVEPKAMDSAIRLVHWFGAETERVYNLLAKSGNQAENEKLLSFIQRQGGRVTVRDVQRRYGLLRHKSAEDIEKALINLAHKGKGLMEADGKSTIFVLSECSAAAGCDSVTIDNSVKYPGEN